MGSEATSYFFDEVVKHTVAEKDQEHIDTIILNHATLPDRTEAILTKDTKELVEKLRKDAEILEKLGVKNIAIPCNTSHYFYEEVQKEISIPIIHMVHESIKKALQQFGDVKKIGILGTTGTINSGIYHKECEKLGVKAVTPSEKRQEDIMSLIYEDVKKGSAGDPKKFERAYHELKEQGSDVVILACTELSVFKKTHQIPNDCLDALDVLVREAIQRSNATYR